MAETALVYGKVFLRHETGAHPENKERVRHAYEVISASPVFDRLAPLAPVPVERDDLLLVHDERYLDLLAGLPEGEYAALDPDTMVGPGSIYAASHAAGGVTRAVEAVSRGEYRTAFCMVRPPGHHALPGRAMGFCVFNNIAVGAAHAVERCGHERVAIIDFDVHHGNGTQAAFYEDDRVLFASLHQHPFYPGTGTARETGSGRGEGKTLNVPLPGGTAEDTYMRAFRESVVPAVEKHAPTLVMISAGFDAHRLDPIGGMRLESETYATLTGIITELAQTSASGRVVSVLEGGYNLDALAESITAHLGALAG
jgi:acetoin utilization deacetylase AcuC-like enzyme